jgi:hypothetical protein
MGKQMKIWRTAKRVTILISLMIAFSLLFLSFVSAQPPFQQSPTDPGFLVLETSYPTSHNMNEDYYIHTHVYNGTNGLLITSGIDCNYHFYNHQLKGGEHIDTGILSQYGSGYQNYTDGSLLNQTGEYSVLLWCNSTTEGGFFKYTFDVTYSGDAISEGQGMLYVSFFLILIFFFVITLLGINQLPSSNTKDEEGKILSISYLKYFRPIGWMFLYFLVVGILFLSSNLAFSYLNEQLFAQILFVLFRLSFMAAPIVVILWIIWIYRQMFHDKQMQNLLNRGFFPQGKL